MPTKCSAENLSGKPCSAQAWRDNLCRWHHPALLAERAEWRRRGGEQRSNAARGRRLLSSAAMAPAELQGTLALVLQGVVSGAVEPGVGTAAASLGRAIVAVREATEAEERLAAVEAALGLNGRTA